MPNDPTSTIPENANTSAIFSVGHLILHWTLKPENSMALSQQANYTDPEQMQSMYDCFHRSDYEVCRLLGCGVVWLL
jgi:hypothetical protein